jgi:hypothetical protein
MRCFEIAIATSLARTDGGPLLPDNTLNYWIPEEAQELLEFILAPYGQDPNWYFGGLNFGRPPAPWAIVCLDREYPLAGHITERTAGADIAFTQYRRVPSPTPADFVPRVGVITIGSKYGLERVARYSPVLQAAWEGLKDRSADKRWLVILDPLPQGWLDTVVSGDNERWLSGQTLFNDVEQYKAETVSQHPMSRSLRPERMSLVDKARLIYAERERAIKIQKWIFQIGIGIGLLLALRWKWYGLPILILGSKLLANAYAHFAAVRVSIRYPLTIEEQRFVGRMLNRNQDQIT